jgi:hypothetical protein
MYGYNPLSTDDLAKERLADRRRDGALAKAASKAKRRSPRRRSLFGVLGLG